MNNQDNFRQNNSVEALLQKLRQNIAIKKEEKIIELKNPIQEITQETIETNFSKEEITALIKDIIKETIQKSMQEEFQKINIKSEITEVLEKIINNLNK